MVIIPAVPRFFIDFPDIRQQQAKLENYLYNHFQASQTEDQLKYEYLMILYQVVDESTVCLMGHERRLTLQVRLGACYSTECTLSKNGRKFRDPFVYIFFQASWAKNFDLLRVIIAVHGTRTIEFYVEF